MTQHTPLSEASRRGYAAATERAGLVDRADRGRIVVSGADRASYLQGLLTNDVAALRPGEGCYACYLTPQGRMITDLWVYELGDVMLLTLGRPWKDGLLTRLDQFIFSEDVKLGDVTSTFASCAVIGPDAARIISSVLDAATPEAIASLGRLGNLRAAYSGQPAIVLRIDDIGADGYELLVDASAQATLRRALIDAGAVEMEQAALDALRIEAGIPVFGRDMDEDTIPLEAGIQDRAISTSKGCYVGQEVIIRVLHRGHGRVARKLVGFTFQGETAPEPGAVVRADTSADPAASGDADAPLRDIGRVTSSTMSPALNQPIALGYVHRDFTEPGTCVSVDGLSGVVSALPFIQRQ